MMGHMKRPHIYILYTGGTIGMKQSPSGYKPCTGHLEALLENNPKFKDPSLPEYTIEEFSPLLDSADVEPIHWGQIARAIADNYDRYDGFVVLHGTDTMAYTASALSFMLENLCKPVVLTGAQVPLEAIRSDGEANLIGTLMILASYHHILSEVFVYFSNTLFRGNRVTKSDADAFNAFSSPDFPPVATAGTTIEIRKHRLLLSARESGLSVVEMGQARVAAIRLFPGIRAEYLSNMLNASVDGVVLECFGAGNVPSRNRPLMAAIRDAVARRVVILAVTQALRGTADLTLYATGQSLMKAGVVSGFDMTCEAALAKLFYLFDKGHTPEEVRQLAGRNLRGELTPAGVRAIGIEQLRMRLGASLVAPAADDPPRNSGAPGT